MIKKWVAEGIGTFWLTFGGCGSAVLAAMFIANSGATPINLGIGLVGVALAFGLTVLTMAYAIGHISGCHLNPAVTLGLVAAKRFSSVDAIPYIVAQTIGATIGAFVLFAIASGQEGGFTITDKAGTFATNGFGSFSPGKFNMSSALIAEVVLTAMFLFIILGATDRLAPAGFAPIAIGLGLTLIHLIGIPVTNLSVNPARSTGPAIVAAVNGASTPITQLWLFWLAPVAGAILGATAYAFVSAPDAKTTTRA